MKDRIILGQGVSFEADSDMIQRNLNTIVCASPGAGKTFSVCEPALLHTNETNLVVSVSKRRVVHMYSPYLKKKGYQVSVMDLTSDGDIGIGWDPLEYVYSEDDISHLSYSIVMADPKKKNSFSSYDPYWDESSKQLLEAITYLSLMIDHTTLHRDPNYADVINRVSHLRIREYASEIRTNLDTDFEAIKRSHKYSDYALSCWNSFSTLPYKTASCVLSTLKVAADSLFNPITRKIMSKDNKIDFESFVDEKQKRALFIITSPVNKSSHAFANLFYSFFFKYLFEFAQKRPSGKLPIPVRFIFDDFATMPMEAFEEYIAIMREINLSCTILIQSESQLAKAYTEEGATTIINCCDNYVYMGANDLLTAKHISERANIPLEDTLNLPVGKEIIFMRGHKPEFCDRYRIIEDPLYQKMIIKTIDR